MHYMKRRRRTRQRRTVSACLKKVAEYLILGALVVTCFVLFMFALINWITQCCEPGGACIPEGIYPQCESVHEEVPYGEYQKY